MRQPLMEIAKTLEGLSQEAMNCLVVRRLMREQPQSPLPRLQKNESPTDIFIDSYILLKNSGRELVTLKIAAASFIEQVLGWNNSLIMGRSDIVMEIVWLCAKLGIKDVAHIIGCLGMRGCWLNVKLPNDEPLSNFSLRILVGMFAPTDFFYIVPREEVAG